jgi:hypothetical protein
MECEFGTLGLDVVFSFLFMGDSFSLSEPQFLICEVRIIITAFPALSEQDGGH